MVHSFGNIAPKYMAMKNGWWFEGVTSLASKRKARLIWRIQWPAEIEKYAAHFISRNHRIWYTVMQSKSGNKIIWLKFRFDEAKAFVAYTTNPSEQDGMLTATFNPPPGVTWEFNSLMLRSTSTSDFGAFILTEPRYVTPANSVQSWSISDTVIHQTSNFTSNDYHKGY